MLWLEAFRREYLNPSLEPPNHDYDDLTAEL